MDINVFFPYYQCGDISRQKEIDLCLKNNIDNSLITKLIVLIDDNSDLPITHPKVEIVRLNERPNYRKWIELSQKLEGISILCNSDIYFDESLSSLSSVLQSPHSFLALSRWELIDNEVSLHPNPHWSQDVWGISCDADFSTDMLKTLEFSMGVPRCDNKIAYIFAVRGWEIKNPCSYVKSIHVHETQKRTYDKKLDTRIVGGVAYVHPGELLNDNAKMEIDVWTMRTEDIKSVALNKSLEKWSLEAAQMDVEESSQPSEVIFEKGNTAELLASLKQGKEAFSLSYKFNVYEYGEYYFIKNIYNLKQVVKTKASFELNDVVATGIIPKVVDNHIKDIRDAAINEQDIDFWQYPCATEKQAYENHKTIQHGQHIDWQERVINTYLPIPWATYVDKKDFSSSYLQKISNVLSDYKKLAASAGFSLKIHTVCQHIHWIRILPAAQKLGVTDLYLSHKNSESAKILESEGFNFNLHGWTLIAVNYEIAERSEGMERKPIADRKLLASFIGAHMPHYRDDSRVKLFEAAKACERDDVFVDLGNEWHFNKIVYEEQVLNKEIESHHIDEHHKKTFRYNTIISDSIFSLCPEGAGPNTLRFWESIAVGTIPVLFSDDLSIFVENDLGNDLLDNVVVWKGNIDESLFSYLEKMTENEIQKRSTALLALYEQLAKRNFLQAKKQVNRKKLRILYVGASVTAQKNGYRPALNSLFEDAGYTVVEKVLATGATGSMFGLCNLSTISPAEPRFDLCIYEYSTGDLNAGLTPELYIDDVVSESLSFLKAISSKVVVLHNYRSDFEGTKGDWVRDKYNSIANNLDISVLDLCPYFEDLKRSVNDDEVWKSSYYRDNVHTSDKGSAILAKKLYDGLMSEYQVNKLNILENNFSKLPQANARFLFFDIKDIEVKQYTYPSSRQEFPYIEISQNQVLSFNFKGDFWGLVSIVGPRSGWIDIRVNGDGFLKYCQLDQHCYYERVQPRQYVRTFDETVNVTIQLIDEELDFSIVKQPHREHSESRLLKISYIMGKNIQISDVAIHKTPPQRNLVCYGASVTAQKYDTGYFQHLCEGSLAESFAEIRRVSFGGSQFDYAGYAFLQDVLDNKPDVCVLDWLTPTATSLDEGKLNFLNKVLLENGCLPVWVFFPRADNFDELPHSLTQVQKIAADFEVPFINLLELLPDFSDAPEKYLRDIVHTTLEGAQMYAYAIEQLVSELDINNKLHISLNSQGYAAARSNPIKLPMILDTKCQVNNDSAIEFEIEHKEGFLELFFEGNIGPHICLLSLQVFKENEKVFETVINVADPWCYYSRAMVIPLLKQVFPDGVYIARLTKQSGDPFENVDLRKPIESKWDEAETFIDLLRVSSNTKNITLLPN